MNDCSICKNYEPVTAKMAGQKTVKGNPDVAEVVRCKDCKHFEQAECPWDELFVINVNDYCSKGERKEGEE